MLKVISGVSNFDTAALNNFLELYLNHFLKLFSQENRVLSILLLTRISPIQTFNKVKSNKYLTQSDQITQVTQVFVFTVHLANLSNHSIFHISNTSG